MLTTALLFARKIGKKTAFICSYGLYQYVRMQFGMRNAGPQYSRLAMHVENDINRSDVTGYMDDHGQLLLGILRRI